MANGGEPNMWRAGAGASSSSSSASRIASLKSLVPSQQRDAIRSFFDRRVPVDTSQSTSSSRGLQAPDGSTQDRKVSWREWAGGKIRGRNTNSSDGVEKVSLFPGWASRSYHNAEAQPKEGSEFSLEVFVSGFAARYVPPESATRSQRAFMRLAKAYASLPKLPNMPLSESPSQTPPYDLDGQISRSTEELLRNIQLPPRPSEITEEIDLAALEKQFQKAEHDIETDSLETESSRTSGSATPSDSAGSSATSQMSDIIAKPSFAYSTAEIFRLHENLNARLQPFWSRNLPNRSLRVSIYSKKPLDTSQTDPYDSDSEDKIHSPIFTRILTTDQQGNFEARIRIPWPLLCVHPGALQVAFGDVEEEQELFICAELLPAPSPNQIITFDTCEYTTRTILPITLSHSRIRLISDIDDTIKLSDIMGGARKIFHNVFVRGLEELVIHGMGDWYTRLWEQGVRFHYVSNSPYELLPVINEFIKVSNLPRGSIKLRSYAGRSLFNGLLTSSANRKRDGLLDILNAFSDSRFFLVGDSGEQDLELYSSIAAERHNQILAIFIRDASASAGHSQPLDDPTGEEIKRQASSSSSLRSASFTPGMSVQPPLPAQLAMRNAPTYSSSFEMTPTQMQYERLEGGSQSKKTIPRKPPPIHPPSFATPTQKSYETFAEESMTNDVCNSSSSYFNPNFTRPDNDLISFAPDRAKAPTSSLRSSSEPTKSQTFGLPSTFYDAGLGLDMSEPSSSTDSSFTSSSIYFPAVLTKSELQSLPPAERKRTELQGRLYRARLLVPSHVPLRIFTKPEECVEAERILKELKMGGERKRWSRG